MASYHFCIQIKFVRKNIFIIIFLLAAYGIFAQKNVYYLHLIYKVNNPENYRFKKNVFSIKDTLEIYRKLSEIKSDLMQEGFLAASIDSVVKDSIHYYSYLFIGNKYNWNLQTDNIIPQALKSAKIKQKTFSGKKINISTYLRKRRQLLEYYDNTGYPFAEINIDSLIIEPNYVSGNLKINPNRKFYFDTIYIKGKLKISPKLIYKNIGIKPGDVFSGENLRKVDENIQKLSFATLMKPSELEFFPGKVDLYLYLKKQKSNFFSGILGFASNENTNQLKLTGNIRLDLNNSFRIGENIALRWESYADSSQYLFTQLKFPYLFFVPLGFATDFELDKTTMDYLNLNYSFAFIYDFSFGNGISMFYRRRQSFLINNDTTSSFGNTDNSVWGMKVSIDNTNRLFVPQRGYKISLSTAYGSRETEQNSKLNIFEADFYAAYYWFVSNYFNVLMSNVSAGIFNDEGFYENEMYKLGGILTVRGFDEKSLLASAYSIFTIEPRFFIGKYSFLSVFADYVYFNTKGIAVQTSNSGIGLGAGFNMDTKAGVFSINFAVGSLNGQPFQLSNTKIHVGYIARF
jgi:outer membrane protein assembly factor BamA